MPFVPPGSRKNRNPSSGTSSRTMEGRWRRRQGPAAKNPVEKKCACPCGSAHNVGDLPLKMHPAAETWRTTAAEDQVVLTFEDKSGTLNTDHGKLGVPLGWLRISSLLLRAGCVPAKAPRSGRWVSYQRELNRVWLLRLSRHLFCPLSATTPRPVV